MTCREHKTNHEIDVLGLRRGDRPRTPGAGIAFLGEAKSRERGTGTSELDRLEHIRTLLTEAGHDATGATLGLFSTSGFTDELLAEASRRDGPVLLAGLDELYGEARPRL